MGVLKKLCRFIFTIMCVFSLFSRFRVVFNCIGHLWIEMPLTQYCVEFEMAALDKKMENGNYSRWVLVHALYNFLLYVIIIFCKRLSLTLL